MVRDLSIKDIKSYFEFRSVESNKGDYGKVGILGGSIKYSGAIKLSYLSLSSLKSGAGLVRVIVPSFIVDAVAPYMLEQTIYPLNSYSEEELLNAIKDLDSLAIGMGLDDCKENIDILTFILNNYKGKLIIDADGLNTLAKMDLSILKNSPAQIVLTPHKKEFSRLVKKSIEEIDASVFDILKNFAQEYNVIVLLKGHTTIVSNSQDAYLVSMGGAGMATSGSGDVLSGIMAGLLGYNEYSLTSVAASAYLSGLAGLIAEESHTDIAMTAKDTIDNIDKAIKIIRMVE